MNTDLPGTIQSIYNDAVRSVLAGTVMQEAVHRNGDILGIGQREYDLARQPVFAIAIGKAAGEMMAEFEAIAGDVIADSIAVAKSLPSGLQIESRVMVGSHPVPDDRSIAAGEQVLRFAGRVPVGALVVCMISGGGSALLESLRPGVTLEEMRSVTRGLLSAGASIHELNTVRARMSRIKAGGLLAALDNATVVNLIISDVLGDDLSTIASGPTVPRNEAETAEAVLARFNVRANLPGVDTERSAVTPESFIIANLAKAIDLAVVAARSQGYRPVVLSQSLTGEARHVASAFASILVDSAAGRTSFDRGTCLIAGGETTVTVRGSGTGGRNTESALAAAIRLRGVDGVCAGFLATDGDDAETGVAGAIVTGSTISAEERQEALASLSDNDSFEFLSSRGATWGAGPTGTNVNDLLIGIID